LTTTWRDLLAEATATVGEVDARWIIEEASGYEGGELFTVLDSPVTVRGVAAVDRMVARRHAGEPLQYVLGRWSFRTLDLAVDRRVLIPRPETEVVAGAALEELERLVRPGARLVAVDLGTGSGAIGLSLAAENPTVEVICTDISTDALAVARTNLTGLGRPATRVTILEGSWFDALPEELTGMVDLIVSNPPYVAESEDLPDLVSAYEPGEALVSGPEGMDAATAIITGARAWLRSGGGLVLELAPDQLGRAAELARAQGFRSVAVRSDLAGRDRVLVAS